MNNIKKKTCKDNKILNPLTNRCVSINSVIGKKILKNNINNNSNSNIDLKDNIIKHLTIIRDFEKNNNNIYKTRAYTSVLSQLYAYRESIKSYEDFKNNIKAGDKIKSKVEELIKTGKINYEKENIKQDKNYHLQNELRKIYGIGNVKIKELINSGIKSIDDLKKNQHLLNDKQKKGLQYYSDLNKLIPLNEYLKHIEILEKDLKKNNLIYDFVGSFRRGNNNMGDIDLLIMNNEKFDLPLYINKLKEKGYILEILALGKIKFSGIVKINNNPARQLDILVSPINEYYYSLLYFTGSAEFNIGLRNYLNNKYGISLSEHGFKENIIKIPLMKSEKEIFDFFNIKYVEPIKRKIFYSS
jgi:DNA polymerase beta